MERTAAVGALGFVIGVVIAVYLNGPLHLLPDKLSRAVAAVARGGPANESGFTDETSSDNPDEPQRKDRWQREWEGLGQGLRDLARVNASLREARRQEGERTASGVATTRRSDAPDVDRLQAEIDRLKRDVSALAGRRPRPRVSPPVSPSRTAPAPIAPPVTETHDALSIRVVGEHVGAQAIALGIVPEATLSQHAKSGTYFVYVELLVTNTATANARPLSFREFQLQDRQARLYSPLEPTPTSWDELAPGQTRRFGLLFAMYDDSAPARLLYKTTAGVYIPLSLSEPAIAPGSK